MNRALCFVRRALCVAVDVLAIGSAFAETCTWTGAWDVEPQEGDAIVIASGDLTWKSPLPMSVASWTQNADYTGTVTFDTGLETFAVTGDVTLNGGTWTHTANPSFKNTDEGWISGRGTKQLIVSCGGNFTINPGATINVEGKGYAGSQGPGHGGGGTGGASHGGSGYLNSGLCYGSPVTPVTIGSAGRDGRGGGAIALTVGGTLTVNGHISANSTPVSGGDWHSAGGSVLLVANAMVGASNITASCGHYGSQTTSGAGGRIALKLTGPGGFSGLTGAIEVKARKTAIGNSACGTIYYETAAQAGGKGKLVLPGGGVALTNGRGSEINEGGPYDFDEIVATNYACLGVGPGVVVKTKKFLGGGIVIDPVNSTGNSKSKIELRGGEFRIPAGEVLTNVYVRVLADGSKLACGDDGDLTIGKNCMIGTLTSTLVVDGDFTMLAGSIFEHPYNGSTDQGYGVKLRVDGDMTVDAGATVTGTERGFNAAGPGRVSGCGSSHGGLAKGNPVTAVYGSIKYPTTLGSDCAVSARYAGGRVRVSVGGKLTMNGKVEATGGWYNGGSYSPSGGSVWIDAGTLEGSGSITACGGRSNYNTGPGGGGRVAVYLTEDNATFDAFEQAGGEIAAPGGLTQVGSAITSKPIGPCGTVYLSRTVNGVTNDVLVIANRDSSLRDYGACIGPNVTDTEVGSVVFKTNGVLRIAQDGILKVRRDFVRDPLRKDKFVADAGDADHAAGTVEFTDASEVSTVTGTNEFAKLVVNTPGKTVKFGTTNEVSCAEVGVLEITGDESAKVSLRSMTDGTQWPLTVYGSAAVNFADVKDSDASADGGLKISAKDSTDGGNNLNWTFSTIVVGETITWTGASDSNWSNVDNWDRQREPVDTDVVVIRADVANMPALPAAVTLNTLEVQSGAQLALAGYYLTVTNVLRVAGGLVCSAQEVISATGPTVDFADGSFTCASSTFVLTGAADQAFDPNGQTFNVVRFEKSGGTVTLADGFDAYQFYVTPSAAGTVLFAAGKTVAVSDCYVSAGTDVALVSFASTEPGTRWNLKVARQGRIQGVVLADSAATGLRLNDDLPGSDRGNNANWVFNGTTRQWIGGPSGDFGNKNNWLGGEVPDETSLVYFDNDVTVTLSEPHTVREFQSLSGTTVFAKSTNTLTVAESLSVESGATLSLTVPCVVSNNVIIRTGGTLTHEAITSAPGALTNRLDLTVCGDMSVEQNAAIDVSEKGFTRTCNGGFGKASASGSSHGGIGGSGRPAYDSVFAPIHPGSSASSGDVGNNGGGAVRLQVGGTLTLNGRIASDGGNGNWYVGTGGSIWITAGRLAGGGPVSANSGNYLVSSSNASSGGRIAVYLTNGDFSDWTGTMTAYATAGATDRPDGATGTIYLQSGDEGDKCGTVYLGGRSYGGSFSDKCTTPFPAVGWDLAEDFAHVKFVVSGRASPGFTADMKIADIVMTDNDGGKPKAYLFDHTVKVESMEHRRRANGKCKDWCAPYADLVNPGPEGTGAFVWPTVGLMLMVK